MENGKRHSPRVPPPRLPPGLDPESTSLQQETMWFLSSLETESGEVLTPDVCKPWLVHSDPAFYASKYSRIRAVFLSLHWFFQACLKLRCLLTCLYKSAKEIPPNHSTWLRIYETCGPEKYFLFKNKNKNTTTTTTKPRQLINCHYNTLRQFNSI